MITVEPKPKNTRNVVLMQHGHCGGAGINYIKQLAHDVNLAGFQAVVMVRRGMETNHLKTPTMYTGQIHDDILATVDFLNKHFDNPNLYGIGSSMGSGLLLRATGEAGKNWPFKA
jgi:hypothetical protein